MVMKNNVWYVAVNDGTVVGRSRSLKMVEDFVEEQNDKGAADIADEYDYEPGSWQSYYQNGYDGGFYDVGKVVVEKDKEDLLISLVEGGDLDITKEELYGTPILRRR